MSITIAEFADWLDEQIMDASETLKDNRRSKLDQNSYGSGYDDGLFAALRSVKDYLVEFA